MMLDLQHQADPVLAAAQGLLLPLVIGAAVYVVVYGVLVASFPHEERRDR